LCARITPRNFRHLRCLWNRFRLEPERKAGFAHLFEHMMFEGTPSAPKGAVGKAIEGGGGWNNG
jgi:predicted Zn-dependent peptidase